MSLVYEDAGLADKPATHIFLVGVGDYRYMRRPGEAVVDAPQGSFYPEAADLERLSSPPASASAMAAWFLDNQARLSRPLGSLRLLLSPGPFAPGVGPEVEVGAATFENATEDANAWRSALDRHPDNFGVFYFCGHGFFDADSGESLLLFEDFGKQNRDFYEHCCNSDKFYRAMRSCAAKTQVYWFDACRNTLDSWMKFPRDRASKLVNARMSAASESSMPIARSTSPNAQSFGDKGGLSRFATTLLDCLKMYGAEEVGNQWMVTTDSIGVSVRDVSNPRKMGLGGGYVELDGNNAAKVPFLRVPDPRVCAKVYGEPSGVLETTRVVCTDSSGATETHGPAPEPVRFTLKMGRCTMWLDGALALGTRREFYAKPPVLVAELE
ncbi:MAG: caspase family protein [Armatimonadetes bacterium]|nr:caspase family protein [Armatimonadota bacterium]